jgi:hypothetical protein
MAIEDVEAIENHGDDGVWRQTSRRGQKAALSRCQGEATCSACGGITWGKNSKWQIADAEWPEAE